MLETSLLVTHSADYTKSSEFRFANDQMTRILLMLEELYKPCERLTFLVFSQNTKYAFSIIPKPRAFIHLAVERITGDGILLYWTAIYRYICYNKHALIFLEMVYLISYVIWLIQDDILIFFNKSKIWLAFENSLYNTAGGILLCWAVIYRSYFDTHTHIFWNVSFH